MTSEQNGCEHEIAGGVRTFRKTCFMLLSCFAFMATEAGAYVLPLVGDPRAEALSESVPTAFAGADWTLDDFGIEWDGGKAPAGLSAHLEPGSLEWVRVNEVLVLPRARLVITGTGLTGRATHAGFSQPFGAQAEGGSEIRLPVALLSGKDNSTDIAYEKDGRSLSARLFFRFKPAETGLQVILDSSCSKFGVSARTVALRTAREWAMIGCRLVQTQARGQRTSSLELFVLWDGQPRLEVGRAVTPSTVPFVWALRLRPEPREAILRSPDHELKLDYQVPEEFHRGSVSLGIGPYSFLYRNESTEISEWTVMPTFYASYVISETVRLVAFDATSLNKPFITDLGVYINSEYFRMLDRRLTLNIMLGVHFLGFRDEGQYYFKVGAPQGVEMIFSDFLGRARNLSLGGFVYPAIQGRSYYNTWVRWGSNALFGELNYISWQEKIEERQYGSRSFGITLGFPIPFLRFL